MRSQLCSWGPQGTSSPWACVLDSSPAWPAATLVSMLQSRVGGGRTAVQAGQRGQHPAPAAFLGAGAHPSDAGSGVTTSWDRHRWEPAAEQWPPGAEQQGCVQETRAESVAPQAGPGVAGQNPKRNRPPQGHHPAVTSDNQDTGRSCPGAISVQGRRGELGPKYSFLPNPNGTKLALNAQARNPAHGP